MSKPINLGRARKRKSQAAKGRAAAANRASEGQSGAERAARAKQDALRARRLEGARRVTPE